MSLTHQEIKEIVLALQESEWDQAIVTVGDVRIAVGRNGVDPMPVTTPGAPPVTAPSLAPAAQSTNGSPSAEPVPAPASPAAESIVPSPSTPSDLDGHVITSPSVGVFWKSPQPGQPPFVEIGSEVEVGDTLCIVEVMKLMNNITADVAGTLVAVHQDNASQIDAGAPLFTIAPRGA